MIALGAVLLVPRFEMRFALAAGPVSNWTEQRFGGFAGNGLGGQFAVGLLLGAVWTPCIGPTLGAASQMAARGRNLGQVALTMFLFGIGTAVPLLLLSLISRATLMRWQGRMLAAGKGAKQVIGGGTRALRPRDPVRPGPDPDGHPRPSVAAMADRPHHAFLTVANQPIATHPCPRRVIIHRAADALSTVNQHHKETFATRAIGAHDEWPPCNSLRTAHPGHHRFPHERLRGPK